MRGLTTLLVVLLLAMVPVSVALADDESPEPVDEVGTAADLEEEERDDWTNLLALRSGGLYDMSVKEWTPYVTTPLLRYQSLTAEGGVEIDIDEDTEAKGLISAVIGLTFNIGSLRKLGVETMWADHVAIHVGPYGRYRFEDGDWSGGVMVSVLATDRDGGRR